MHLAAISPDEIEAIHAAGLRVLDEIGILIRGEARDLLLDHGAHERGERLCLPPELVETCLRLCPSQVTLRGRGGSVTLGAGELHVHNMGGARDVIDTPGGALRPAVAVDVGQSARLLDALENITTITPLYTPRDVPPAAMTAVMFAETVQNTLKPINGPGVQTPAEVRALADMARIVLGDDPAVSVSISPISPLTFPADLADAMLEAARQGLPLEPLPCPQVGVSAPVTIAGALAQQHAELLACVALAQLARPGLPVIYCGRLATVDMRTVSPAWGSPEIGLISAATVQLAHRCGLPANVYGLACSGFLPDIQNGYERAMNALVPALAGADELSGVGEMAGGVCSSNVQIVIDNEILGAVRRVVRGFAVDGESLAHEVIETVMDSSMRTFMAEPHTVRHLRAGELWRGRLGVQGLEWQQWLDAGRPHVVARAQAEAARILAEHRVPPLPEEQSRALAEVIRVAGGG